MTKREKVALKIRALLSKTETNGCSESEAILALAKAKELMNEYNLSTVDISDIKTDSYGKRAREFAGGSEKRRTWHRSSLLMSKIAELTHCRSYRSGASIVFFGEKHDTLIAWYMLDLIRNAMDHEFFKVRGKVQKASFMSGMMETLANKLTLMIESERNMLSKLNDCKGLMVCKDREVSHRFNSLGLNLQSSRRYYSNGDTSSFNRGKESAKNINLRKGVKSDKQAAIG